MWSKIRNILCSISVEPVFVFYMLCFSTYYVVLQNLMIEKACTVNLNETEIVCNNLEDPVNVEIQNEVQKLVTNIKMYSSFCSTIPAFIFVSFLGPLSDSLGRRTPMILPFLGHVVIAGLLNLNVYCSWWPIEATLLESIWGFFGGGFATVSSLGYSYISDVSSAGNVMARISILDGLKMLSEPAGTYLSGILFNKFGQPLGYYIVFTTSGIFALLGVLYVIFFLKESVVSNTKTTQVPLCSALKSKNPLSLVKVVGRPRQGLKRMMIVWSFCILTIHYLHDRSSLYLYTRKKFGWSEEQYTIYSSLDSLHSFSRAIIVTPFLSKVLNLHDPMIGMMGALSWVTYFAVTGLATQGWMMYLATGLSSIGGLTSTPIIALLCKLVEKDETGALMAGTSGKWLSSHTLQEK